MALFRCEFPADAELLEALSTCLFEAGAEGLEETPSSLVTYTSEAAKAKLLAAFAEFNQTASMVMPEFEAQEALVSEADPNYHAGWLAALKPVKVTSTFTLRPTHCPEQAEGENTIWYFPRPSFGTGSHATTKLAARAVEALAHSKKPPEKMLDVGCGSGVLSLVGLKSGIKTAYAIDIDEESFHAARENADKNKLSERLRVSLGSTELVSQLYPLLVANIELPILRDLLPEFARCTQPGGTLVLTGLLDEDVENFVKAAEAQGLSLLVSDEADSYALLVFKRQS